MKKLDKALKTLEKYEKIVFDNEDVFINKFSFGAEEIIGITFGSDSVEFIALINEAHIINSIKIWEFKEFLNKIS